MRAGQFDANPGPAQVGDRVAIQPVGSLAVAQQGADAGLDAQHPVSGRHRRALGAFGEPVERGLDQCLVAGPGGRLGQLGHDKGPNPRLVALEGSPAGVAGGVVAAQAVGQHRLA